MPSASSGSWAIGQATCPTSPAPGLYVLCFVIEDVDNLFGGPYTGTQFTVPDFIAPVVGHTGGKCAAELHDDFNFITRQFHECCGRILSHLHWRSVLAQLRAILVRPRDRLWGRDATVSPGALCQGPAGTDSDSYTYLLNIQQASQTGSGSGNACANSDNYCQSFSWLVACNDMIVVETFTWGDPDASCTTDVTTSLLLGEHRLRARAHGQRASAWGKAILGAGSSDPQLSAGPGFLEWFTDASDTAPASTGYNDGNGGYSQRGAVATRHLVQLQRPAASTLRQRTGCDSRPTARRGAQGHFQHPYCAQRHARPATVQGQTPKLHAPLPVDGAQALARVP